MENVFRLGHVIVIYVNIECKRKNHIDDNDKKKLYICLRSLCVLFTCLLSWIKHQIYKTTKKEEIKLRTGRVLNSMISSFYFFFRAIQVLVFVLDPDLDGNGFHFVIVAWKWTVSIVMICVEFSKKFPTEERYQVVFFVWSHSQMSESSITKIHLWISDSFTMGVPRDDGNNVFNWLDDLNERNGKEKKKSKLNTKKLYSLSSILIYRQHIHQQVNCRHRYEYTKEQQRTKNCTISLSLVFGVVYLFLSATINTQRVELNKQSYVRSSKKKK